MTPNVLTAPIYKGAKYEHLLTFYVKGTTTRVNLTGLGPFVCVFGSVNTEEVLLDLTVTEINLATGQLQITALGADTEELPLGPVRLGLRDAQNNPYVACVIQVLPFSPPPA